MGINRKLTRFIDSLRVYVKGGSGGNGFPRYGGEGGKGGDIYVRAENGYTLRKVIDFHPAKRIIGARGEDSSKNRILGRSGARTVIEVPVGISVYTDIRRCLGELDFPGQEVLVARGGAGGSQWNQFSGQKGQSHSINLDLKLIADIGFVGFPNAGKSTLLKALSRASPKIANYPFTTLSPNIGIMEYEDLRQISLADLPGLIEGAHVNKGLGHKFLKHVERTKMLMFVVDIQGFSLKPGLVFRTAFETILLLNKELELYEEGLMQKPAILVVTKLDTKGARSMFQELLGRLDNCKAECEKLPSDLQPSELVKFDAVIPVCSHTSYNIPKLKEKLRTMLDLYAGGSTGTYSEMLEKEKPQMEIKLI